MNRADLTKQVLLYEQLAAAAREKAAVARAELDRQAKAELETEGMAPTWRLPDVGTITLPLSQEQVYLADEAAVVQWAEHHSGDIAVETVKRLRPDWLRVAERYFAAAGDVVVDTTTGEVVPGYAVRRGGLPQSLSIRPSADAKALARVHADGLLERFEATLTGKVEP